MSTDCLGWCPYAAVKGVIPVDLLTMLLKANSAFGINKSHCFSFFLNKPSEYYPLICLLLLSDHQIVGDK